MKWALSPEGRATLRRFCEEPILFTFDYDGTLAPIVYPPDRARIPDRLTDNLEVLCHRSTVAVVSGRSLQDLQSRLSFHPTLLYGNHGAEGNGIPKRQTLKLFAICRTWRRQLRKSKIVNLLSRHHIDFEDKGYSLAIHYRNSESPAAARQEIRKCISQLKPQPRLLPGKNVYNLVVKGAPDKGYAVQTALHVSRLPSALYIGDDETDESVFALQDPRILGIRVGRGRNSHAQFYLRRQSEISGLLKLLLEYTNDLCPQFWSPA